MVIKVEFDVVCLYELNRLNIIFGKFFIVVGVGDVCGISVVKVLQVNGEMFIVELGIGLLESRECIYILLLDSQWVMCNLMLVMLLNLSGIGSFLLVFVGCSSEMILISNWLYLNFVGDFFFGKCEISGLGFQVQW